MNDLFKVIVKKKVVPIIVEFCLEESLEVIIKPQAFPDVDWDVTLKISDIKKAVEVGVFLRENRIDVAGFDPQKNKKPATLKKGKEDLKEEETEIQSKDNPNEKSIF